MEANTLQQVIEEALKEAHEQYRNTLVDIRKQTIAVGGGAISDAAARALGKSEQKERWSFYASVVTARVMKMLMVADKTAGETMMGAPGF